MSTPAQKIVTEVKTIKISNTCIDNPVALYWKNTLGGWDMWVFGKTQTIGDDISDGAEIGRNYDDIEDVDTDTDVLTKEINPQMILGADNLDFNDVDGLRGLLRSPKVQMLVSYDPNDATSAKFLTVKLISGTFKIKETSETKSRIEFTIQYPKVKNINL